MAQLVSRRRLAKYAADQLLSGGNEDQLMRQIAAHLLTTGTVRSAHLVVAAIEDELQQRGVVVATVTMAHPLTEQLRQQIEQLLGGDQVHLRSTIDPAVIGGVKLKLPDSQFDDTIQHKLMALKGMK